MEENQNEKSLSAVKGFGDMMTNSNTQREIFTNITDEKMLFNLENNCDFKINDCIGEKIRVKGVVVKKYTKPLENPIVDEETGEIIRDTEVKMPCILIDENGKSYVTGSKMFSIQMVRYIQMFGMETIENEGLIIEICQVPVRNSGNKALGFKLV